MLADRLTNEWLTRRGPIDPLMRFSNDGLTFGAGTVLAAPGKSSRDVRVEADDPRLIALLTAAHLGRPAGSALAHLRKAADRWAEGDEARAAMHLVLSRLDRLEHPDADAHRMFLADQLLKSGVAAQAILDAIVEGAREALLKFDPNQPRVPAGSGRSSGEWTAGGGGPAVDASDANAAGRSHREGAASRPPNSQRQRAPLGSEAEVNTSTVTPAAAIQGTYEGPEACQKARMACVSNIGLDAVMGYIGPNQQKFQTRECMRGEQICLQIEDEAWDRESFVFGGTIFSDKSVVLVFKGGRSVFYPREIAAIKWPRLRGLQRF